MRWALPEQGALHADAACHEVEACEDAGAGGVPSAGQTHSARQTAPGRALECSLPSLHPGAHYQVTSPALVASSLCLHHITISSFTNAAQAACTFQFLRLCMLQCLTAVMLLPIPSQSLYH